MRDLEEYYNFINTNLNNQVDINKLILRFSLINQKNKSQLSEFFTFNNKKEVLNFLKDVVVPSITLSALNDNNNVTLYLREEDEIIDMLDIHIDYFSMRIKTNYLESVNELKKRLLSENLFDLKDTISFIENKFDAYNDVYITLDFGLNTIEFLKSILNEYNKYEGLGALENQLKQKNLSVEKIKDTIANINQYKSCIREEILDKIPY